jgi:hypothetical protein
VNTGKRFMQGGRDMTALVAVFALVSGCASLPSLEKARTVSLVTNFPSYSDLIVDVDGNPDTRPGKMAVDGFAVTEACGILFFACAIVTVPLGALTGAVITAVETLPEQQAQELNRVSANVIAGLSLSADFDMAMRAEASRHGIVLRTSNADARIDIVMTRFEWDVSVGNNVAIRIDFKVTGVADGKTGYRNFTIIGERAKAPEWMADSGKRIGEELITIMDEASRTIWRQALDRDG